ncbi:hypothetical protein C943_03310 [Mariniradius saccharolyticus AK6]|uniref:DUF4412 domain-containing protein n=1 Tax=Mariniradius saccharolyticus AK6 TaxID=1239962 RepID=M7XJ84_9BACT|nr:hypothetical protein [Mariniradius saccharolyticus]EMS34623.1 hypothetical protein C943_03310 [Mariniradius saccharolyticus AK6]
MKRIFFIIFLVVVHVAQSQAQEKYATYFNSFLEKDLEIEATFDDPKMTLYINGYSLERASERGGFMVSEKMHAGFLHDLKVARDKYVEWRNVAIENDVRDLRKDVELQPQRINGYFNSGSKWYFDFSVVPTFRFLISEDEGKVTYRMFMMSGKLQASTNEYIDTDGFIIPFSTIEEFDEFIDLVTMEKIEEFKRQKKDKSSLFKN